MQNPNFEVFRPPDARWSRDAVRGLSWPKRAMPSEGSWLFSRPMSTA